MKTVEELDRGLAFLNSEVGEDCTTLRQEVLYMRVYQSWENCCFYGVEEDPAGAEDTQQVLIDFLHSELGIDYTGNIEFQRVHKIGPVNLQMPKPQQIIACFLGYPDCEMVMSNAGADFSCAAL